MRFADVAGHERAKTQLVHAVEERRIPSGLCLLGPPGVGKRALADAFAALLVCEAPANCDSCGRCPQCVRLAAGTHPDVRVVQRDEDRRDVRVEQVRELARWLSLQSMTAAHKVAIIDDAHHLNEHGQNALLKTLEEPPGAAVLILISRSAALLLPTVRSRCCLIRVAPVAADAVARVLEARGVSRNEAADVAPLAEGSPGRALALAGEEESAARKRLLAELDDLGKQPAIELSRLVQGVAGAAIEATLRAAIAWYRDVLQTALAGDALPLRLPAMAAKIRTAAARLPARARLRQLEVVCDTLTALEKNANRSLTLETLLLALREIERGHEPWIHT